MKINEISKDNLIRMQKFTDTSNINDKYVEMYNTYRNLFSQYIIELLEIREYDEKVLNNKLHFKPLEKQRMDIYQKITSDELKFFYLRNNLYIEKLTTEEIEFLNKKINNKNDKLDDETKKFIEKTYKKVIFEDVKKDGKQYIIFFGPNSKTYMARNDSIVIGFSYELNDKNDIANEDLSQNFYNQMDYVRKLLNEIEENSKEKVDSPIKVICRR